MTKQKNCFITIVHTINKKKKAMGGSDFHAPPCIRPWREQPDDVKKPQMITKYLLAAGLVTGFRCLRKRRIWESSRHPPSTYYTTISSCRMYLHCISRSIERYIKRTIDFRLESYPSGALTATRCTVPWKKKRYFVLLTGVRAACYMYLAEPYRHRY